jgi:hypothetical protein
MSLGRESLIFIRRQFAWSMQARNRFIISENLFVGCGKDGASTGFGQDILSCIQKKISSIRWGRVTGEGIGFLLIYAGKLFNVTRLQSVKSSWLFISYVLLFSASALFLYIKTGWSSEQNGGGWQQPPGNMAN